MNVYLGVWRVDEKAMYERREKFYMKLKFLENYWFEKGYY